MSAIDVFLATLDAILMVWSLTLFVIDREGWQLALFGIASVGFLVVIAPYVFG